MDDQTQKLHAAQRQPHYQEQQQQHASMMSIRHALEDRTKACSNVMGMVIKISIDAVTSKAQMLIADNSIPADCCARVSLSGTDTVTPLLAEVSVGDVLYFHDFRLTRHDSSKQHGLVVADFYSTWQEPDAGWSILHRQGDERASCQDTATTALVQDLVQWSSTTKLVASIPTLPCRRRRFSELNAVGIKSHVVARVVSVDAVMAAPPSVVGARAKRRRWLPLKKRRSTIAVLTDDGNDVIPLLDCAVHEATLKTANQNGCKVLITNVVTCAAEKNSDRDIVLRPTDATAVFPMLSSTDEPEPTSNGSNRGTQCLSLTQEMPVRTTFDNTVMTQTLSSPLRDIFIDELNISLGDGKFFVSPNGFVSALIDQKTTSSACYRQATLTLDKGMVVKADADMMQVLCGSMDPQSILDNRRLRGHVTDLIRGLLEEEVVLTWTLQQDGDAYHATRCVLPKL